MLKTIEANNINVIIRDEADLVLIEEVIVADTYGLSVLKHAGFDPHVIIDIGAHIGTFSLMAHSLWPNAKIVCVEPNPENFPVLTANAPFAHCINAAIGKSGKATLIAAEGQSGSSFVANADWEITAEWKAKADNRNFAPSVEVECKTFSDILAEAGIEGDIDFLKIDCEGGEFSLLESLSHNQAKKIKRVAGEYHHPNGYEKFRALAEDKLPHLFFGGGNEFEIGPFWGVPKQHENSKKLELYLSSPNLRDSQAALYAACGAANVGADVVFYTQHYGYLMRAVNPGLIIAPFWRNGEGIDIRHDALRKSKRQQAQSYCDKISEIFTIERFIPSPPHFIDKSVSKKMLQSGLSLAGMKKAFLFVRFCLLNR